MSARQLGTIGILGTGWVVSVTIALHVLDPELDPVKRTISEYALGPYWWLQKSSDLALGTGILGVGLGLRRTLAPRARARTAVALLLIVGASFLLSGIFDPDPIGATDATTTGAVHATAAMAALLGGLTSAWLLRGVFAADPSWRRFAAAERLFALAITLAIVATFAVFAVAKPPAEGPVGLVQRVLVAVLLAWLATLAWQLRLMSRPVSSTGAMPG